MLMDRGAGRFWRQVYGCRFAAAPIDAGPVRGGSLVLCTERTARACCFYETLPPAVGRICWQRVAAATEVLRETTGVVSFLFTDHEEVGICRQRPIRRENWQGPTLPRFAPGLLAATRPGRASGVPLQ